MIGEIEIKSLRNAVLVCLKQSSELMTKLND